MLRHSVVFFSCLLLPKGLAFIAGEINLLFLACAKCCRSFSIAVAQVTRNHESSRQPLSVENKAFFYTVVSRKLECSATCSAVNTGAVLIIIPTKSGCESTHLRKISCVNCVRCSSSASSFLPYFPPPPARPRLSLSLRCVHASHFARVQSTAANRIQKSTVSPLPQSQ